MDDVVAVADKLNKEVKVLNSFLTKHLRAMEDDDYETMVTLGHNIENCLDLIIDYVTSTGVYPSEAIDGTEFFFFKGNNHLLECNNVNVTKLVKSVEELELPITVSEA